MKRSTDMAGAAEGLSKRMMNDKVRAVARRVQEASVPALAVFIATVLLLLLFRPVFIYEAGDSFAAPSVSTLRVTLCASAASLAVLGYTVVAR